MAGTAIKAVLTEIKGAPKRSANAETTVSFNRAVTDLDAVVALVNQTRTQSLYRALGNPAFAILTNFDVQNANAVSYLNNGTLKTLAAAQTFDTGTAATIATVKWGAALLSLSSAAATTVTWFTASGAGYATEALAIAAITAAAATNTVLGYITVLAAGSTWTAGTDALAGGTGGTPATTTNYYNSVNPNALYVGAALTITASQIQDLAGTVIV